MRFPRLGWASSRPDGIPSPVPSLPPRTPGVLRELGPDDRTGEIEIRAQNPLSRVVEEVLWVPDIPGDVWGVFNPGGEPLPESLDYNLPWNEPMWLRSVCPVRWSEVADYLPDEDYLYLGFVHIHFGHFLVDSLSRLWPLAEGLKGRKILFHGWGDPAFWRAEMPWAAELFEALGLRPEDFVRGDRPMRVRRLELPDRSIQGQTFAHTTYQHLSRAIGAALLNGAESPTDRSPVYLSKSRLPGGVRRVVNEHQLETFLRGRGVEIAYPEMLSLGEKIAWFAGGRTVIGTANSGFHLSLFAPPNGRIIGLEPQGAVNSNFLLLDRLNGNHATYLEAVGTRHIRDTPEGWMLNFAFRDPVAIGRELLHFL